MKQRITALLLIVALLLTAAGCSAANTAGTLDRAEDRLEDRLDAAEDAVRRAVTPAPAAIPSLPAPVPTDSPASDTTVTRAQAENIALQHAGFSADQVQHLHSDYEIDDGTPQYDVEFFKDDWEYEFEIHAEDGRILSFDKDHRND